MHVLLGIVHLGPFRKSERTVRDHSRPGIGWRTEKTLFEAETALMAEGL